LPSANVTAATGTGNMVLSASPTLTGTLTSAGTITSNGCQMTNGTGFFESSAYGYSQQSFG
jgi:hypothetical protein